MGLFGKKKEAKHVATAAVVENKPQKASSKGKKAKNGMASILNESVTESAIALFRENEKMSVRVDGQTVYVGMLLDVNDPSIGGINKKSVRDEAKGQVIELINSGRIATYIPASYLEVEKIVIIPNQETLDSMDEFSLLTEANYTVAFVRDDGAIKEVAQPITYANVVDVMAGSINIADYVQTEQAPAAEVVEAVDDSLDATQDISPVMSDFDDLEEYDLEEPSEIESEVPFGVDEVQESDVDMVVPEIESESVFEIDETEFDEPVADEPVFEDMFEDDVPEVDEISDESSEGIEEDVSEEQLDQAITRKFYADDLGLEVTTEPFDIQFMGDDTFVAFEENREEGWLNNYLNEMSRSANQELQHLHKANLQDMRAMYFELVSRHAEQIQHDVDENDPETVYGKMLAAYSDKRVERKDKVSDEVKARRDELDKTWNNKLEQIGEDAARDAQQRYTERFGKQHEARIARLEPNILAEIEDEFRNAVRDMRERQRSDALKRMDYGISESLAEVSNVYVEKLKAERELYTEHRKRIDAFLDEHRADDIAHDKVLAEEHAQATKAERVMTEYEQKIKSLSASFDTERAALKSAIEETERLAAEQLETLRVDYQHRIEEHVADNTALKAQIEKLIADYALLDDRKSQEYEERINTAKKESLMWSSKYDEMMAVHKRGNIVAVTAAVVAVVAALSVGVLVGMNISVEYGTTEAIEIIDEEFSERLSALETEVSDLSADETDETVEE